MEMSAKYAEVTKILLLGNNFQPINNVELLELFQELRYTGGHQIIWRT